MTRVVYIHHLAGEHDLEPFLRDYFQVKKVFAGNDGEMMYQGTSVPYSFFDHHADVVVTTLPMDLHRAIVNILPHIPVVGIHGYHGMFADNKHREIWQKHAKNKSINNKNLKIPHSIMYDPQSESMSIHELRNKVFLPSNMHIHGHDYGSHAVKTFPELQQYISGLNQPTHIERQIKGEHVYIVSIKDFRDQDIYTTPLIKKTDHGYQICNNVSKEQKEDASRFAQELHAELGLGPVAQFEFVLNDKDLYLVNIEPNPRHTDNSTLHAGLESIGSSMKDLWKTIVENARKNK